MDIPDEDNPNVVLIFEYDKAVSPVRDTLFVICAFSPSSNLLILLANQTSTSLSKYDLGSFAAFCIKSFILLIMLSNRITVYSGLFCNSRFAPSLIWYSFELINRSSSSDEFPFIFAFKATIIFSMIGSSLI